MSSLHTRPATEDDVFIMEQIMRDAFAANHAHFLPEAHVREWFDSNKPEQAIRQGLDHAGIVEIMGRIVGFIIYEDNFIEELWVDPNYEEQGAGRALIEWLEEEYRSWGYPTMTIYCYESNINALEFLKKMRFRRASQFLSDDVAGGPVVVYNMLRMVKNLKR